MEIEYGGPVVPTAGSRAVLRPLAGNGVRITGGVLALRQSVNGDVSLYHAYRMLAASGALANFEVVAGKSGVPHSGASYADSDVYKWLEAVQWQRARGMGDDLRRAEERVVALVEEAQLPDGYVHTYVQSRGSWARWQEITDNHEAYNLHHLIQAGIAEIRSGGEGRLMSIATRAADQLGRAVGARPALWNLGHPGIEMALVELFRVVGERRYLELAERLLESRRGRYDVFIGSGLSEWEDVALPRPDDRELAGHAVCTLYLAAGMADVVAEGGDARLAEMLHTWWTDLEARKSYITGNVGSRHAGEAIGRPFELPSARAYCETCAGVAIGMWAWRMLLYFGDVRYAERFEQILWNAVLCGVGLDGTSFFYVNPLASDGEIVRAPWFRCPCCPTNIMRFLAQLEHYVATLDDRGLRLEQYVSAAISARVATGTEVSLRVETTYPAGSSVTVYVDGVSNAREWRLKMRVPAWCVVESLRLNGESVSVVSEDGYISLTRTWVVGDSVQLVMRQDAEFVDADRRVHELRGQVALRRGPLVYCAEEVDQGGVAALGAVSVDTGAGVDETVGPDELGAPIVLVGKGRYCGSIERPLYDRIGGGGPSGVGVTAGSRDARAISMLFIPYYLWANRGQMAMRVWFDRCT